MRRSIVLTLAGIVVAGSAAAEPIAVEYVARRGSIKKVTTSSDMLQFDLYSDSACTNLIDSEMLSAGDALVSLYVDKPQRLNGSDPLPKAVRIHAVIDAPTTTTAPYLLVTGPGIEPVGSACQIQASGPFAALGPQGDPGPQGVQGDPGPQGVQGDPGPQGVQGDPGPQGVQGDPGPQGVQGDPGPQGVQGDPGPQGVQGDPGPQGVQGDPGPQGVQGDPGPQGAQGDPGPQGVQGDPGPQGVQGDPGPQGAQGDPGPQGVQGDPGPQGVQGDPGPQGVQGDPGPQGVQGDPGPQGVQGDPGPQGAQGDPGPQGVQGDPGPQGAPGANGADGVSNYLRVAGAVSASNSTTPKTVTADCTGGRKVLGGGYTFTAGTSGLVARESRASDDDTWTVTVEEVDGVGGAWSVQAFAVCATAN